MAIYDILSFPDPRLRHIGEQVDVFDADIQRLIDDMLETMYHANGIGLAATQIGVQKQIATIDISSTRDQPMVIINPEIIKAEGTQDSEEGCLSVPGAYDTIQRAAIVLVSALDRDGKPFEINGEGLLANCLQHEVDHLNGKLFVDYLSPLKRNRIKKKLEKAKKQKD